MDQGLGRAAKEDLKRPSISCIWRCTSVLGGVRRRRGLRLCAAAGAHSSPTAALTVWYVLINPPSKLLLVHRAANAPIIMCLFANANFLLFSDFRGHSFWSRPRLDPGQGTVHRNGFHCTLARLRTDFALSPRTNRIRALIAHKQNSRSLAPHELNPRSRRPLVPKISQTPEPLPIITYSSSFPQHQCPLFEPSSSRTFEVCFTCDGRRQPRGARRLLCFPRQRRNRTRQQWRRTKVSPPSSCPLFFTP
jgi:hypothetical protein